MHITISEEMAGLEDVYDALFYVKHVDGKGNTSELQSDQEDFSIDNILVYFPPVLQTCVRNPGFFEFIGC